MRNLLGRLNARSSDDLLQIAQFWRVSLPGADRGRHVGVIYRVMTDIRACRDAWERFDATQREIIRFLAGTEAGPQTISDLTSHLSLPEQTVRDGASQLFRWGVLSVQGDNQELPIGEKPRLFLPRELGQDYRRILDEIESGNQAQAPLRILLEGRDDPDLEETATIWGLRIIPGLRRRQELVDDILHQISRKQRIDEVVSRLSRSGRALFQVVRASAEADPMLFTEAVNAAKLTVPAAPMLRMVAAGTVLRGALIDLESSALVLHTYLDDGRRALFVPHEIVNPGTVMTAVQLPPLQPLEPDGVTDPPSLPLTAIAWDLLTVVREIISRGAPVWVPGEPLSLTWQRQLNRRLWFGRDELPPDGYTGLLLYLGLGVGVLEPGPHVVGAGGDKHAIRPVPSATVRQWRGRSFAEQIAALRDVWLVADQWIEGREREQVDVWGADWQGFRRRLLGSLRELEADAWLPVSDVARWIAQQEPGIVGSTFTAASARGYRDRGDARSAVIAQIVEVELETAMMWFGFVDISRVSKKGLALRVTEAGRLAAGDSRAMPDPVHSATSGAAMSMTETGQVMLNHPTPLHIWSLTAFGDAERLRPEATYQLRPGSVGRALGAGFDLDQITSYLERQTGQSLPDGLMHLLREWTAGYKRVRMRRAAVLTPDFDTGIDELRKIVTEAGLEIVDGGAVPQGGLVVLLPATGEDADAAEEALQSALRAAGFAGQWAMDRPT